MRNNIKLLGILPLLCLGTVTSNIKKEDLNIITNCQGDATIVRKNKNIGKDYIVSHSKTYVQYGTKDNAQFMRFATALKGNVSNLNYELSYTNDVEVINNYPINTVYKAVLVNDVATYYDGLSTTLDESYAGDYYWACLTIKFNSSAMKDVIFNAKFSYLDDNGSVVEVETKSTSLDDITPCKVELVNGVFENGNNFAYVTKNDALPNIGGSRTPLVLMDMDNYSIYELNYQVKNNAKLAIFYLDDASAVTGYYTPSDVVKYNGSEVANGFGTLITEDVLFKNGTHYEFGEKAMNSEYTIIDDGASKLGNAANPIASVDEKSKISIMSFRNNNDFDIKFSFGPEYYGKIYALDNLIVKAHESISLPMFSKAKIASSTDKPLHFIEFKEKYESVNMDIIGHFINKTACIDDFMEDSFIPYVPSTRYKFNNANEDNYGTYDETTNTLKAVFNAGLLNNARTEITFINEIRYGKYSKYDASMAAPLFITFTNDNDIILSFEFGYEYWGHKKLIDVILQPNETKVFEFRNIEDVKNIITCFGSIAFNENIEQEITLSISGKMVDLSYYN